MAFFRRGPDRRQLEEVARQQAEQLATFARQQQENEQRQREWQQEQRWQELKREAEIKQHLLQREAEIRKQQQENEREQQRLREADLRRQRVEQEQRDMDRLAQQMRDIDLAKEEERRERRQKRMRQTTPKALRELRDLIRERYQLDLEIWNLKGARVPDRPYVEEKMEKADAILLEIMSRVETWNENEGTWTPDEWRCAQIIRSRVMADGKRHWKNNPPWNEKSDVAIHRAPYPL